MTPAFRLGTTSFIDPAGWADNVEALPPGLQDVELLCFESDPSCLPDALELQRLSRSKVSRSLSYTVHTPLDVRLASDDDAERARGVARVRRVIQHMRGLVPYAYVVHVYFGDGERPATRPADVTSFQARAHESLRAILDGGVEPERVCIELLDYDFSLIEPVVDQLGLSIALDLGHAQRDGRDLRALLARLLPRTKIIQWHGTDQTGRDHRSLACFPQDVGRFLLHELCRQRYHGVLTLEVFTRPDLEASLALVRRWLALPGHGS